MTRPLRILVAHNVPHNRRGGMSRIMAFLHDRVEEDGHTVEYFAAEQVPARWKGRWSRIAFPWLLWRHAVRAAQAGRPYDAINVHEPSGAILAMGRRAAGFPAIVVTTHGLEERSWKIVTEDARLGRTPLSRKTRILQPWTVVTQARTTLRHAAHVCCLNEDDRAYLQRVYHLPSAKITRLFPAADPAYAAVYPQRDYKRADRLLVFGTWLPRKGAIDIVRAFEKLAERHPQLKLMFMGVGFPPEIVKGWFPTQLHDRLEFAQSGTEAELAEQMLAAAIYWIPSLFEGTPQTLLETMATGMPAISTATCGMKDVIRHENNGLLIPLRDPDALARSTDRLLTDHRLREQLGRQAHADVSERYTWDRVAQPLREVYQQLAKEREGRYRGEA